MEGDAKVFLEKDRKRREVSVDKLVGKGGPMFLFRRKKPNSPQQQPDESAHDEVAHESVTEDDPATEDPASGLSEDDPVERETSQKMWLADQIVSLENETES